MKFQYAPHCVKKIIFEDGECMTRIIFYVGHV